MTLRLKTLSDVKELINISDLDIDRYDHRKNLNDELPRNTISSFKVTEIQDYTIFHTETMAVTYYCENLLCIYLWGARQSDDVIIQERVIA